MKYLCGFFLFFVAFAGCADDLSMGIDPNDVDGQGYVDPYDAEEETQAELKSFVDPYDQPEVIKPPETTRPTLPRLNKQIVSETKNSWRLWKERHLFSPKPPLNWSQVGMEIGGGYAGAFAGSVAGLFGGFIVGSLYDAVSNCEQCWVDVAVNMTTLGAGLGAAAGVYMFGSDDKQQGSLTATYIGTLLPVVIGTIAYQDGKRLNKSGLYLTTMPLFAVLSFNLTRYYRGKDDKPLFENILIDEMWVSSPLDNVLVLNAKFKF